MEKMPLPWQGIGLFGWGANRHGARVACQTGPIPVYARNAAETAATEATEMYRNRLEPRAKQMDLGELGYVLKNTKRNPSFG